MSNTHQMAQANDTMREVALEACTAAQELARVANGNDERVIPAPTVCDLLGELKVLLWHLNRDPATGADRDPTAQATLAAHRLRDLSVTLDRAAVCAEAAQATLNSSAAVVAAGHLAP